jgi:hypothetical protein
LKSFSLRGAQVARRERSQEENCYLPHVCKIVITIEKLMRFKLRGKKRKNFGDGGNL